MNQALHPIPDELLVKYLLEEASPEEKYQVEQWLLESAEHQTYFDGLKEVWEKSQAILQHKEVDEEAAWLRLQHRLQTKTTMGLKIGYQRWLYIAASVVLLLTGYLIFKPQTGTPPDVVIKPKDSITAPLPKIKEVITAQQTKIDTLSDNSIVTLNKNARLEYPETFKGNERRVKLNGEAFFNITPNKEKPFFIDAGNDVEIRVVGTSFNVKSNNLYTEVVVETGIVEVRKFNRVVLLHRLEKACIGKGDSTLVVQKQTDKLHKYYRSKEFECDNTPLWRVVEVLNEAYGDSIVIGRKELRSLTLTTRFDNQSLENILNIISETFDIQIEKSGHTYILK